MNVIRNKLSFEVIEGTPNESFWKMSDWESETYRVLDEQLQKDKSYLDIGAWIGPTVLYGAQLSKKAYTFEPDPVAWDELQKNIAANPSITNIVAHNFALSDVNGTLHMGSDNRLGESVTRVGKFKDELSFDIECRSLDDYIASLGDEVNDLNFVKMDIEGGEVQLAKSKFLKDTAIPCLLSVHPPMMRDFQKDIEVIMELRSYYLSCEFKYVDMNGRYVAQGGKARTGSQTTDQDFRTMTDYYTILLT